MTPNVALMLAEGHVRLVASLIPDETIGSDGLIVQRGRYTVSFTQDDRGVVEDTGKYVIVCQEGTERRLQILWDIDNSDSPSA